MAPKRTFSHVWEVIQELDAWMQHAVQASIEFDLDMKASVACFENARNLIAAAHPNSRSAYLESGKAGRAARIEELARRIDEDPTDANEAAELASLLRKR